MLGSLAYQNGRNDIALELVNRAIAIEPRRASYNNSLGGALLAAGRVDDAITVYRRAFALAPGSIEVANNWATRCRREGGWPKPGRSIRPSARCSACNGDVLYNMGYNVLLQGDTDPALAWLEKAAAAKPGMR